VAVTLFFSRRILLGWILFAVTRRVPSESALFAAYLLALALALLPLSFRQFAQCVPVPSPVLLMAMPWDDPL
jgi:hypothetical protein